MRCLRFLAPAIAAACLGSQAPSQILLQDDFNDNALDPALWNVVTTGLNAGSPNVLEQNQRAEMIDRGYLVSVAQFDPVRLGGIKITGNWTFAQVGADFDFLQALTRSDGLPSGTYGEAQNGLEFVAQSNRTGLKIQARGSLISIGQNTLNGGINFQPGQTYEFEIIDAGANASFTVWNSGRTAFTSATVQVLSDQTTVKHVVFHNREYRRASRVSYLDNVLIRKVLNLPAGVSAYGTSTSGCTGGLEMSANSIPQVGNMSFALSCDNAPPNATGGVFNGASGLVPPMSPFLLLGAELLIDPAGAFLIVGTVSSNQGGLASFPLPIPAIAALRGAQLYSQFVWIGPTAPVPCPAAGLSASQALHITVQ